MRCAKVRRLLSAYMDERVSGGARLAIGLHLSGCRDCGRHYAELRRQRLALLGSPRLGVPPEFSAAWRSRLHSQDSPACTGGIRLAGLSVALPAAACLMAAVLGAVFLVPRMLHKGVLAPRGPAAFSRGCAPGSGALAEEPNTAGRYGRSSKLTLSPRAGVPPAAAGTPPRSDAPPGGAAKSAPAMDGRMPEPARAADENEAGSTWRVLLVGLGEDPEVSLAALRAAGYTGEIPGKLSKEAPLAVREGLSLAEARALAGRLERGGCLVALAPMPDGEGGIGGEP